MNGELMSATALQTKIREHQARVTVVGVGYVGLPLAVEIARAGFSVTAYDKSEDKVRDLRAKKSYIKDVRDEDIAPLLDSGKLKASSEPSALDGTDVVIVCVPTPLNKTKDPDNSFIIEAAEHIAPRLRKGMLVVLESTTFPGFTREVLLPQLSMSGLTVGEDFFLAFSPERVDPGNERFNTHNTPKVIGGMTPKCTEVATAMYSGFIQRLVPVSSTDAAEMVKLLENTYRAVNIGLVNEIAIMCGKLKLDTWEVIDAAATKPFGFMPFYPGPGLGGHCIPVDPHYLSWKLKTLKYNARFIELAGEINSAMPDFVVHQLADALNDERKSVSGSRILVLGVAYKRDIDDCRESPALDILALLDARGAQLSFHDPHVPSLRLDGRTLESVSLDRLESYDAVVIVTNHSAVDYGRVVRESKLVLDTRNATRDVRKAARGRVVSL
jgi:UDP-N-acetyl-D-glucosamine dehydrogenase